METKKYTSGSTGVIETQDIVITRTFNVSPDSVWKYWTEPEKMKLWWAPKGFTAPYCKIDFRVGGSILFCMRSPEGKDIWGVGNYREIVPNQRIVWTDHFADEKGNVVPATFYGMSENYPLEMQIAVTFEEQFGRTKLTIRHSGIPAGKDTDDCRNSWNECLDKLERLLS